LEESVGSKSLVTRVFILVLLVLLIGQAMAIVVSLVSIDSLVNSFRQIDHASELETEISDTHQRVISAIVVSGVVVSSFAFGALLYTFLRIKRYFSRMDFEARKALSEQRGLTLTVPWWAENRRLIELINTLTIQLSERIQLDSQQKTQERAILSSMIEGVMAIDTQRCIINMNEAAAELFHVSVPEALGRRIEEIVRISAVLDFIQKIFDEKIPVIRNLQLYEEKERYLRAHGTLLFDESGDIIGALVVLFDITRMQQLEMIRKEFAANVSHELRTPITGIKGFVETLLEGKIGNQDESKRYLEIIARQTDRLAAIIDDLLSLARIEQHIERDRITVMQAEIRPVIERSAAAYDEQANRKGIEINIDCDESLSAEINTQLLEQAIGNLIDNAIKYSDSDSVIDISARQLGNEIEIAVNDQGCGIEERHFSRLFERFYRVDKARSRDLGGTGLGLAIVKHIAISHRGRVEVESSPGEGSKFIIRFPSSRSLFLD
jgi:two-component system phosphate regulon sensor histidine kinase PhoR